MLPKTLVSRNDPKFQAFLAMTHILGRVREHASVPGCVFRIICPPATKLHLTSDRQREAKNGANGRRKMNHGGMLDSVYGEKATKIKNTF